MLLGRSVCDEPIPRSEDFADRVVSLSMMKSSCTPLHLP